MYTPHTERDIAEMLDAIGVGSLDDLLRVPDAVALKEKLDVVPALPEYLIARRFDMLAKKNTGRRVSLVPRGGRLSPLRAAGDRGARDARRVSHRVHAVSSRGLARLSAGDLRVADLHLSAHRHGYRQRVGLRRRDGAGRGRDHGAQRDRAAQGARFARDPPELSRGARDLLRRARRRDRRDSAHGRRARRISRG